MADLLRSQRVSRIAVLSQTAMPWLPKEADADRALVEWQAAEEGHLWRSAENSFVDLAENADEVLVIHMGGYAQLDVQEMLTHHYENRCRITAAVTADGQPLHFYAISANRRNDAAQLFRSELQHMRTPCKSYVFQGYSNPLQTAADFRRLTIDALLQRIPIAPFGTEVRPGVWIARSAKIDSTARLVPPVFIGERARIMRGALVTRCAVVEHSVRLSEGVVVENATVLPSTCVGRGVELKHCVASGNAVEHLRHGVAVEVNDSRLLSRIAHSNQLRLFQGLRSLLSACSMQSLNRLAAKLSQSGVAGADSESVPGFEHAGRGGRGQQSEFGSDVAVARRYGNQ
jgi:NDP-sugar pyrophosphorylase family protein